MTAPVTSQPATPAAALPAQPPSGDAVRYRVLAWRHLLVHLRTLNRRLAHAVEQQALAAAELDSPHLAHLAITDRHARSLLARIAAGVADVQEPPTAEAAAVGVAGSDLLEAAVADLRVQAADIGPELLPLDLLGSTCELDPDDTFALVVCAAPEVDACYQRLYSYVADDLAATHATPSLLARLAPSGAVADQRLAPTPRQALGRLQRLRRTRLVVAEGDNPFDVNRSLRLTDGLFDFLVGEPVDLELLGLRPDRSTIGSKPLPMIEQPDDLDGAAPWSASERAQAVSLGMAMAEGVFGIVGIWSRDELDRRETIRLVMESGRRPHRVLAVTGEHPLTMDELRYELQATAALGGVLVISIQEAACEPTPGNPHPWPSVESVLPLVDAVLSSTTVPIVLEGATPWRPPQAVRTRRYGELELAPLTNRRRRQLWSEALPNASPGEIADLAARYRLDRAGIAAAVAMAGTDVRAGGTLLPNGDGAEPVGAAPAIGAAVAAVSRTGSTRFATAVIPQRRRADLVLPDIEMAQIDEIGRFHRAWPHLVEAWGFRQSAGRGVKALFVGDPGTGKTLAAEVIANDLGVILLKVDLAQVVSKWVGETEKNLDSAFREAEATDCVLFFDEADALFGKRGEIRHGTDRYANLEIGYLLQRLEDYEGIVILASNLHDNIDAAFGRRFQFVVHFPRPDEIQRRRLWRQAFPSDTPVADLDVEALARLELTGAGIASSAQGAALLAAAEGADEVAARHIAQSLRRQFQREGRALRQSDLGPYGDVQVG